MTKPIGNLLANLATYDKVSGKTKARYGPKSLNPLRATPTPAAAPANAPRRPKPKTRKR
jgi:hypothetical protein